jgi:small subunit ribosomal protein S13
MARLLGVDIPNEKRIEASLQYVYGIGPVIAKRVLEAAGIDPDSRTGKLTTEQIGMLVAAIQQTGLPIEGDLRRDLQLNLKRLQQINCYRGIRHRKSLPVRGQRTQTNSRTRKGKRKTIGVVRAKK